MAENLLKEFKNPQRVQELVAVLQRRLEKLSAKLGRIPVVMEVCGTHTMAFAKTGLRQLLKDNIRLVSGPGCPVCVTSQEDIDTIISLARQPDIIVATFGDLLRVPGTQGSLLMAKAAGADIRVVYSPREALVLAHRHRDKQVVFLGIGFETTAPPTALVLDEALCRNVANFSLLSMFKTAAPVLQVLVNDPSLQIDGFILPGHVGVIIGENGFAGLAGYTSSVITGFEPLDMIQGLILLTQMIAAGEKKVGNQYTRLVRPQGNTTAQEMMHQVFRPSAAVWRGFGKLAASGLQPRDAYKLFDTRNRFSVSVPAAGKSSGCICAEIIRGKATPRQCPHFAGSCNPVSPLGPCMVSAEGICCAYYRYERESIENERQNSVGAR